jgi:hypothetical protein
MAAVRLAGGWLPPGHKEVLAIRYLTPQPLMTTTPLLERVLSWAGFMPILGNQTIFYAKEAPAEGPTTHSNHNKLEPPCKNWNY